MAYPKMNKTYSSKKHGNLSTRAGGKTAVKYIVVHYTGTSASAANNCKYFSRVGAASGASADYFIDASGIWKYNGNCKTKRSWHCGCSSKYRSLGATNNNSIGIEVVSNGNDFTAAEKKYLRKLVKAIMKDFGIPAKNVVRHYDANTVRKRCPAPYCGSDAKNKKWLELHEYITK